MVVVLFVVVARFQGLAFEREPLVLVFPFVAVAWFEQILKTVAEKFPV